MMMKKFDLNEFRKLEILEMFQVIWFSAHFEIEMEWLLLRIDEVIIESCQFSEGRFGAYSVMLIRPY